MLFGRPAALSVNTACSCDPCRTQSLPPGLSGAAGQETSQVLEHTAFNHALFVSRKLKCLRRTSGNFMLTYTLFFFSLNYLDYLAYVPLYSVTLFPPSRIPKIIPQHLR